MVAVEVGAVEFVAQLARKDPVRSVSVERAAEAWTDLTVMVLLIPGGVRCEALLQVEASAWMRELVGRETDLVSLVAVQALRRLVWKLAA